MIHSINSSMWKVDRCRDSESETGNYQKLNVTNGRFGALLGTAKSSYRTLNTPAL